MTDAEEDPLEDLVVDKSEVNRKRLSEALNGILAVDVNSDTPEIIFRQGFNELETRGQITALLLGRKVMVLLGGLDESEEGLTSAEISKYLDIAASTVRLYTRDKLTFVSNKEAKGGYFVPNYNVNTAIDAIS